MAQRVGRGIALLFHDRGTRRGCVVSSTPRPLFTPGKDPEPILQKARCAPGPVWMGGKSRPHRDPIPDRPARSQSLYRLSYPAHNQKVNCHQLIKTKPPELSVVLLNQRILADRGSFRDLPRKLYWDKTFRFNEKKREAILLPTRGEEDGSKWLTCNSQNHDRHRSVLKVRGEIMRQELSTEICVSWGCSEVPWSFSADKRHSISE